MAKKLSKKKTITRVGMKVKVAKVRGVDWISMWIGILAVLILAWIVYSVNIR